MSYDWNRPLVYHNQLFCFRCNNSQQLCKLNSTYSHNALHKPYWKLVRRAQRQHPTSLNEQKKCDSVDFGFRRKVTGRCSYANLTRLEWCGTDVCEHAILVLRNILQSFASKLKFKWSLVEANRFSFISSTDAECNERSTCTWLNGPVAHKSHFQPNSFGTCIILAAYWIVYHFYLFCSWSWTWKCVFFCCWSKSIV